MKRDWKLSLPQFARRPVRRTRRRSLYRRIVAPERLEQRNAPGAMLPMLPFVGLDGIDCEAASATAVNEVEQVPEARSGAISESTLPSFGWRQSFDAPPETYVPVEVEQESLPSAPNASPAKPVTAYEVAARDAAFAVFNVIDPGLPLMEHPAFREPAEESAAPQVLTDSPELAATALGAEAISYSTATDGGGSGSAAGAPQATTNSGPAAPVYATTAVEESTASVVAPLSAAAQLTEMEVEMLLARATRATNRTDAIIAIVDRGGQILGVHVEADVNMDPATLVFAIDGAVAKARTAAFFSNDQAALTSRTVRFISQSTITQREVEANPNESDPTLRGPGFVAPIGLGGHFPPDVLHTPHVDLFAIEHTNRDSVVHPGPDRIRQSATVDNDGNPIAAMGDDILLVDDSMTVSRFGANFAAGKEIPAPESYGMTSGMLTEAQSRGIATLPGGVPLYRVESGQTPELVGGIGVFFPGEDGYATFEQGFVAGVGQSTAERLNAPLVLEAEYTAALVASNTTTIAGLPPVDDIGLIGGRIDLVGITLESVGPHPFKTASFLAWGQGEFTEGTNSGGLVDLTPSGDMSRLGTDVPDGWLVEPTASAELTADEVRDIIERGVEEAERVRAAIRLPLGSRTRMVLAVTDLDGKVLGLYRMPDATFFSIDVAVAKARNVAYYADGTELEPSDQIDGVDAGVAFTNRTFRFVAEPRFPSGVDGSEPPAFSTLNTPGIDPVTAENIGTPPLASDFQTPLGFDAFNPGSNFHEPVSADGLQNGVVFFPGSTPLYRNGVLVGGLGVSGDGVDQDDVVTFSAAGEFLPRLSANDSVVRADEVFVDGVRLPYQKFLRNPRG